MNHDLFPSVSGSTGQHFVISLQLSSIDRHAIGDGISK